MSRCSSYMGYSTVTHIFRINSIKINNGYTSDEAILLPLAEKMFLFFLANSFLQYWTSFEKLCPSETEA